MTVAWTSVTGALILLTLPGTAAVNTDLSSCDPCWLTDLPGAPPLTPPRKEKLYVVAKSVAELPNNSSITANLTIGGGSCQVAVSLLIKQGGQTFCLMEVCSRVETDPAGKLLVREKSPFNNNSITERFLIYDEEAGVAAAFLELLRDGETTPVKSIIVYSQTADAVTQDFYDKLQRLVTQMCAERLDVNTMFNHYVVDTDMSHDDC